jgi:predicted anti-sigma-YlaC factor YlaD
MPTLDEVACQKFVELVTDYLEEVLPELLRARVEAHLEVCPPCRLYLGQMRLTLRALRRRENSSLSPRVRRRLLRQFREWRRDQPDSAD